ncbi:hypothetical protein PVAP13_2KG447400 [Panicum virgatum]|uniref:Uncharacterized protein n=1 Tax=Panicum virgatum TaxID=38727 RepID=A0A8T0WJX4_PANVG|nr:hypothetical protein PVAP13_2KG447400 [Panicum virgatum]
MPPSHEACAADRNSPRAMRLMQHRLDTFRLRPHASSACAPSPCAVRRHCLRPQRRKNSSSKNTGAPSNSTRTCVRRRVTTTRHRRTTPEPGGISPEMWRTVRMRVVCVACD